MENISPSKEYSVREIVTLNVLGRTASTVLQKVLQDLAGPNILNTRIEGARHAKRYRIKGENIIKYLSSAV